MHRRAGKDFIGVSVGAVLFNEKGEVFLSKRGEKAKNEKGKWEFPGGAVHFNESLEEACKREFREEYGIEISLEKVLHVANHIISEEKQHWVATTFLAKLKSGQPKILEPLKCSEIGWFKLNALPQPLSIVTELDLNTFKKKFS